MDVDQMFPGRFIKAGDFAGKPWVTPKISKVTLEKLEGNTGARIKGIVFFEGYEKGWVMNRTNAECLRAMFGRDTDGWMGKRVTLHPVVWSGEDLAIRVKGSPDLEKALEVEVKLPRKKPFTMKMEATRGPGRPTGPQNGKPTSPAPKSPAAQLADAAEEAQATPEREPGSDDA